MTRRSKPYLIELSISQTFKLSASEWDELIAGGWAQPISDRIKTARLVTGVAGWIRGCDLFLLALARMRTVAPAWAHAWLYRVGVIRVGAGEAWDERHDRVFRELEEALWIESFLWRSSRDKKRQTNSFAWIDAEHKMEIIRALKSEGAIAIETSSLG